MNFRKDMLCSTTVLRQCIYDDWTKGLPRKNPTIFIIWEHFWIFCQKMIFCAKKFMFGNISFCLKFGTLYPSTKLFWNVKIYNVCYFQWSFPSWGSSLLMLQREIWLFRCHWDKMVLVDRETGEWKSYKQLWTCWWQVVKTKQSSFSLFFDNFLEKLYTCLKEILINIVL